jgi:FkbM family methyltransferase
MAVIRGVNLELHPQGEALSDHIRRENDFFEAEILDYLAEYHRKQKTIVDIGANIGNHSVYFANFLEYENILCFEPIPANFDLLRKNMAPYPNVGLAEMAVSDMTHSISMRENRGNMGASSVHIEGEIRVLSTSLDRIGLQDVTLMKIDVEGHEPQVLDGAMETMYRCHPLILIEDWENKYDGLLKDYVIEKAWFHHHTFLYRWEHYARVYSGGI